jgi:tetratricopeptide (TPR) repeat protein
MSNSKPSRSLLMAIMLTVATLAAAQTETPPASRIPAIQSAIRRNPLDSGLYIQLGLAYWDNNDDPDAFAAFEHAAEINPHSAEAHNWLGTALMKKSDLPGAVTELRKAVALDPKLVRAYANLGAALARSGDIAEAVTVFRKALALDPNSAGAHLNLGLALREKGDVDAALIHLRRAAKAEPKNAMVRYELGQTMRQSGDLAGAISSFEEALQIDPELQEGYYGLGLALKQQSASLRKSAPVATSSDLYQSAQEAAAKGDLNTAKDRLLSLLQKEQSNAEAENLLGYILGQQRDLEFARNHLERAVKLRPSFADAHYNYGVALWYSGMKAQAISELSESVRLDPAAGASYGFLGMAMRETGDSSGARKNLERAIALLPPTTATYIDLGIVFLATGNVDRAIGQFEAGLNAPSAVPNPDWETAVTKLREALAKRPNDAEGHNLLGLMLGREGAASSEVIAEFRKAIKLRPDYAQPHNNIGLVLAQSDDDANAVTEFREAVRLSPKYADAHCNLGATLIPTDAEQAITELEKAVALDPASVKAQFNLAEAYAASPSHGAKELEQLRKVVSLSPDFARGHMALGKALLHDGKIEEAVKELQDATRLDPQSGEAHYQFGLALARAGRQKEATAELQKGRELSAADERNQNAELDISEGRAAMQKGELEEAAAKFQHAIKLQPDSAVAQHALGVVLAKQGDAEGASAAFKKALDLNPGDQAAQQALGRMNLPDAPTASLSIINDNDDSAKITEYEAYIRQERFSELEPLLDEYLKQYPKSYWGWYALGYSQFAQKHLGASIQSLAKSLQLNIRNPEAHKILGRDLMMIGRFDAAQTEFEQGLHYDPKSAELHYNLGKLFSMQDNWENARKEFEAALQTDPSYVEAIDALGLTQEALGLDSDAVASYEKAIALNEQRHGNFASAHVNLSAYYNRTGDSKKATEYAQKALELDPKSDPAWFQKARASEHDGDLNGALDSLSRAISINSRSSSYYYVLASVYRKLGKADESKKALEMFTRLDHENNELEKMRRNASKSGAQAATSAGGKSE